MIREVVDALACKSGGLYVDCTVGGGGHSMAILEASSPGGIVIGIDRDPEAIEAARTSLAGYGDRIHLVRGDFRDLLEILDGLGIDEADGILADLGVSSHQLESAARGFSYNVEAPLDMRMNPEAGVSARDIVNGLDEDELARIIGEYGEERFSRRIARFIVRERSYRPIETTTQLVDIIKAAIPAAYRRRGPHPARRTFQALRIAVNGELDALRELLEHSAKALKPGGRVCIISYHSLEDRIVKRAFLCMPLLEPVSGKPVTPSAEEVDRNPRARSAKLRVARKVLHPQKGE
ncbi:MAG TPA: 16S rRNA (cytosine(1402)-N(4))-methyltransferase RsmH [Firmicutes bacterium]|nr:16S rRNA (cytosine(1402)-N(4))-methyltransferase RsmH [Bacillota bacterium]